ncbi:hypothetical protein ACS5NO_30030 [Larkinella sp. GY13]|uniref:hypothetical protein n=1 Tax=Larkinella sp. GY13 TaxID=3453720 RepID=UPI003EE8F20B
MKMRFLALLALVLLSVACKKGGNESVDPTDHSSGDGSGQNPNSGNPPPATGKIPAELVGKWSYGTFSPTNFWDYNGKYTGNAYEQALVFEFHANGTYEEYVINSTTSYNCRTEAYTFFKGTVKVNEANRSFVITPTSGNYRGFYGCAPKSNINRDARKEELKQETMNYQVESGKTALKLSDAENPQGVRLKAVTW